MNIDYIKENYRFMLRTSAVIFNKEKNKILIFQTEGKNYYLLPGGRVEQKESSNEAIKREIREELGWNLDFEFLAFSEEFIDYNNQNIQRINVIYKATYNDETNLNIFKGLEGDWINFKWINIKELNDYNIYPKNIKSIITNPNKIYHFIEKN